MCAHAAFSPGDPAVRAWVEEFAIFYERDGLPRMAGRILGWLLVCVPPHQSLDDLAAALQGSKASMSTMTRLLVQAGLVTRTRPPGSRSDQFVVPTGHWDNYWRGRLRMLDEAATILQRGAGLLAGRPAAQRTRLEELRNEYLWMSQELPRLFARWRRERRRQARGDGRTAGSADPRIVSPRPVTGNSGSHRGRR